jgi:hypothetical protein
MSASSLLVTRLTNLLIWHMRYLIECFAKFPTG